MNEKEVYSWLEKAKQMAPDICDWIGIYYKASYINGEESTDLVLGPYIGAATEHTRIPIDKGICGLALRDEVTANIADVKSHPEYISCSIETRSELVIPLKDKKGNFIAELDIDSHSPDAFTEQIQKQFEEFCLTFDQLT
jgi:putative methionine-R-sulfoxide reductase with GAF domain